MSILANLKEILILLLVLIVGYQFLFPKTVEIEKPVITEVVKTDTTFVNVVTRDTVYVPKFYTRRDTVLIPTDVDTISIIEDYYSEYVYTDTLAIDTLGYGYLEDVLFMNRIKSRKINWDYNIPVITTTIERTITLPPKREFQFYLGASIIGNQTELTYVGPNIGFKTKNDTFVSVGAGILGTGEIGMMISSYYRFRPFR